MSGNQRKFPPAPERFAAMVDKTGDCWVWTGYRLPDGYGMFGDGGSLFRAHRWAWEQENGPIPPGVSVLHRCDNPPCVRVAHLYLGSQTDNMQDASARGRLSSPARSRAAAAKSIGRTGESNANARLTDAQAIDIYRRYTSGGCTLRGLAAEYGVHNSTIARIVNGERRTALRAALARASEVMGE